MAAIGRKPTCECGVCRKCKRRESAREWYRRQSPEKKQEIIQSRNPEKTKAADRARYYRQWEERRASADKYQKEHWSEVVEDKKAWAGRNPDKRRAQHAANNAVRDGKLIRQPCEVCGATEWIQKHHDDYSKPLNVRWLCPKHHGEVTRKY